MASNVSHIAFRRGGVTAIIGSNAESSTPRAASSSLVRGCKGTIDVGEGPSPFKQIKERILGYAREPSIPSERCI